MEGRRKRGKKGMRRRRRERVRPRGRMMVVRMRTVRGGMGKAM
jgi:hypothetical protein